MAKKDTKKPPTNPGSDGKDKTPPADSPEAKAAAEAAATAQAEEEARKKAAGKADDDGAGDGDADPGDDDDDDAGDEDWRARMAGGDAETLDELKRYDSEESLARAVVQLKKKLREKGGITLPKADAPVEEKAAFYTEHMGRPEKAEDIKLEVNLPENEALNEGEAATVKQVAELMHKAGVFGAEQIEAGLQMVADLAVGGRKELEEAAGVFRTKAKDALTKLWKRDFEPNLAMAQNYMAMRCEEAGVDRGELANVRLENGALLGDHPLFLRVMALGGRDHSEDPGMLREEAGGAKAADLKDALDKEMAKRNSNDARERRYYDSAEGKARREKLRKDLKRLSGSGTGKSPKR